MKLSGEGSDLLNLILPLIFEPPDFMTTKISMWSNFCLYTEMAQNQKSMKFSGNLIKEEILRVPIHFFPPFDTPPLAFSPP